MRFDLHIHTTLSACSQLRLPQLLAHAKDKGLDGVCITDHDTMAVRHSVSEGLQENGLCVLFGMEYATSEGDFLIFGPFEDLPPGLSAEKMLKKVIDSGGIAVGAHPFRSHRQVREKLIRNKLCTIVEGMNGRNSRHENEGALQWQKVYNVGQVGGSDAHTVEEIGKVATSFTVPIRSRNDLINALKQGKFKQVSSSSV